MRVGIFDSGVGGLSVLEVVKKRLPQVSFFYCCDNLHFPYGTKTDAEVIQFTTDGCVRFVNEAKLDGLVIACNTASAASLPSVRSAVSCPVIGVVPAVKPAAKISKTKCIGVLATHGAVKSFYLKDLIAQFADGCEVRLCGSSHLVEWAEQKIRGESIAIDLVREEIASLFLNPGDRPVDTVVLGCTHFPLLREELMAAAPWPVQFIDSGEAIAARIAQVLPCEHLVGAAEEPVTGYGTGDIHSLWPHGVPQYVRDLGLATWHRLS